ncbi:hypothetical protein [Pseudomonas arsenicoxydans]|uniref:Uncharacterized protein n=1 Tax=Pseudomonas arsenicoxydans TaxID=702115 RepID=A0A502HJR9_9PSED|nr:hypothetical protein [Pseudomonas arsenicoxydans]TPG73945.1 hypothetical protein EAH78_26540 [Pseudomonas arsenicoxydans]
MTRVETSTIKIRQVRSSSGLPIDCTYLEHPAFDEHSNLCQSLHLTFIHYVPQRLNSAAYLLRKSINLFFEFFAVHTALNPKPLHLKALTDITAPVFKSFANYVLRRGEKSESAIVLRSALSIVARETEVIPLLDLPPISPTQANPTHPLAADGAASIQESLNRQIDLIYEKLHFRDEVHCSTPYTFDELSLLIEKSFTEHQVMVWVKYHTARDNKMSRYRLATRTKRCVALHGVMTSPAVAMKLLKDYELKQGEVLIPPDFDPEMGLKDNIYNWKPDWCRFLKTFMVHDFPFNLTRTQRQTYYSHQSLRSTSKCTNAIQLIIFRLTKSCEYFERKYGDSPSLSQVLYQYYPSQVDVGAIVLMMMLQSGWNKETVMAINPDDFEHALTGVIESNIKIIFSEKVRGSTRTGPYSPNKAPQTPKRMYSPSNAEDPYSLYNLILLAKDLIKPLYDIQQPPDINAQVDNGNPLFSYMNKYHTWKNQLVSTLDGRGDRLPQAVGEFLQLYPVVDNGERLVRTADVTRRLRPTWTAHRKQQFSLELVSQMLGHEFEATTDIYYDSSPQAHRDRLTRLRGELEEVLHLLRIRKFKGLLSAHAESHANADLHIFHIPGHELALWGCTDRYTPDWYGHRSQVRDGELCAHLEQCCFCSRVRILQDSLPYLIERRAHIEEQLSDAQDLPLVGRLEDELTTLHFILDNWQDNDAIKHAVRYRNRHKPLLPRNLSDLNVIFKTGEMNE